MSELNRPETPGPWEFGPHDRSRYLTSWGVFGGAVSGPLTPDDFAAIADLPAWIEAHDEWKARAEKAEAALSEIIGELNRPEGGR